MDFYIFPEMGKQLDPRKKKLKRYKISYHFEKGMDKPEIKIEGDINEKELKRYLKGFEFGKDPRFKMVKHPNRNELIDATEISLEPDDQKEESYTIEPFTEIHDCATYSQIIIEVPGIQKEDIKLEVNDSGNKIKISAHNQTRKYFKEVDLPFKTTQNNIEIDVNNGIATLKVCRK
jgi:HSP20 family molecular chaperone IbpA